MTVDKTPNVARGVQQDNDRCRVAYVGYCRSQQRLRPISYFDFEAGWTAAKAYGEYLLESVPPFHKTKCLECGSIVEVIPTGTAEKLASLYMKIGELEADGWRPIETAPKDGTRILATDKNGWCDVVNWCLNGDPKWVVCHEYYVEPTHWRPLPDPPKEGGQ